MLQLTEIIGFNRIFETENSEDYLLRINEIPRELLIDVSTHLLSFDRGTSFVKDYRESLHQWFGPDNNQLANEIYEKINHYSTENSREVGIINPRTSLTLFEKVLASDDSAPPISDADFEVLIFKIYLSLNEMLNKNDDLVAESSINITEYPRLFCLAIGNSIPTFDITNFDLDIVFVCQIIKAILLFEFLQSKSKAQKLLEEFYLKFNVRDHKEFFAKLLPISFTIISMNREGKIDLKVENDDKFKSNTSFLDKLTINHIDSKDNDIDYLTLRANPLIKISYDTYRVIYPLFVLEKNFNGLYFLLKEINDGFLENDRINLRQMITFDFSEKHLLYTLLNDTYKNKYKKISGEQMTTPGAPDYYIRNGNKVFIFESKDILINATIKESYDFIQYEAALKDKLYFHAGDKKVSAKAVKQLASFSNMILTNVFNEDTNYKPNSVTIYPIILLHNRQLDIVGLNNLINIWFNTEKDRMKMEGTNVQNLRMPTIIMIDTLILLHERLANNQLELDVIIDEYQEFIDEDLLRKKKFKSQEDQYQAIQDHLISFHAHIINKYKWRIPQLFKDKAISLMNLESQSA
jgi:hypothetical protein